MDLYTCFFKVCLSHVNACWVGVGTIPDTNHIYREKTDKRILKKNPWKDYRLHVTVLVLVIILIAVSGILHMIPFVGSVISIVVTPYLIFTLNRGNGLLYADVKE